MASELSDEQRTLFTTNIDTILSLSDLNTISAKRIRKGLQDRLGMEYDIAPFKQAITEIIMERFDKFQSAPTPPPTNGDFPEYSPSDLSLSETMPSEPVSPVKRKANDDDLSDVADSPPPKKAKKIKKERAETDEEYAMRLQAELDAINGRSTRGGGARRQAAPKKKTAKPKKKSKAKVGSDDDSDVLDGDKPEKEKKGGFHKPMTLSEPLAALLDTTTLSRPQTVKQIWAYVKERDLQDPNDKRQIRCDDAMKAVFKQDKVHMFTMNKILAQHLHPAPVEEVEAEA